MNLNFFHAPIVKLPWYGLNDLVLFTNGAWGVSDSYCILVLCPIPPGHSVHVLCMYKHLQITPVDSGSKDIVYAPCLCTVSQCNSAVIYTYDHICHGNLYKLPVTWESVNGPAWEKGTVDDRYILKITVTFFEKKVFCH